MNDYELDNLLKKGKKQSEGFFSEINTAAIRKAVEYRVSDPGFSNEKRKRKSGRWPLPLKAGLAAASCLAVFIGVFSFIYRAEMPKTAAVQSPVAEQAVSLDNSDQSYLVSYLPVEVPKYQPPSLMTILWGLNKETDPKMLYSSLFEKCDEPYPVSTIGFLGTDSKYILLSSGDSKKSYIHYKLIGFSDGAIDTFWSEDFVPNGALGLRDGLVVERINTPDVNAPEADYPQVAYIIPYNYGNMGGLFLPVEKLQLHVGDQMLLVGHGAGRDLHIDSKEGIVKEIAPESVVAARQQGRILQAYGKGEDVLSIREENGNTMKNLLLNVVE